MTNTALWNNTQKNAKGSEMKSQIRSLIRSRVLDVVGAFAVPKSGVHILGGHFITPKDFVPDHEKIFGLFLLKLKNFGQLIDIQDAVQLAKHGSAALKNECLFALTFDDGFEECSTIASILNDQKINAAFFINANFIESNSSYQEGFFERIKVCNKFPLTWLQLQEMYDHGHIIGSHTSDHMRLSAIDPAEQKSQLVHNKEILEQKLGHDCAYFAWPYGAETDINETGVAQACELHKYVFSSFGQDRYFSFNDRVINRRHMEPYWPTAHIKYFLSKTKR